MFTRVFCCQRKITSSDDCWKFIQQINNGNHTPSSKGLSYKRIIYTFKTQGMNITFSISYNKIARNLQKLLLNILYIYTRIVCICLCISVCVIERGRGKERQEMLGFLFSVLRTESVLHSWKPLCQNFVPCLVYYFVRLFGLTSCTGHP